MPILALLLAAFASPVQDPPTGPAGFRALTFNEALAAAQSEQRCVLVDFFTAGAPETKVNEELLWKDEVVRRWLAEPHVDRGRLDGGWRGLDGRRLDGRRRGGSGGHLRLRRRGGRGDVDGRRRWRSSAWKVRVRTGPSVEGCRGALS